MFLDFFVWTRRMQFRVPPETLWQMPQNAKKTGKRPNRTFFRKSLSHYIESTFKSPPENLSPQFGSNIFVTNRKKKSLPKLIGKKLPEKTLKESFSFYIMFLKMFLWRRKRMF